ncbi:proteinase B [Entomophthora muscae]|uniref:Proteinase B n=1 Tax=Entomophthora muscae TaxID=34485 RepID=A0ACC2TXX7_9FUNG|nr:proteinase B [Entomophthora muscae]
MYLKEEFELLFQTGHAVNIQSGYIVTLKSSTEGNALEDHIERVCSLFGSDQHSSGKNKIKYEYRKVLLGYSAEFTDDVLAKVKAMPEVAAVEKDQLIESSDVQENSPWGLARLSSEDRLTDNEHLWSYNHDPRAGVDVFVVDSGIETLLPEFQGCAYWGANFVNDISVDETGHGTHMAGIIGSKTYGVAKSSTLIAVKVIDGTGFAGVEWAVQNKLDGRGCVINVSLRVGRWDIINNAVGAAVDSGCVVTVCAGNDNSDACFFSPASEPRAITVGASNLDDKRAYFSNWGTCLDVFAPGEDIVSTSIDGGNYKMSGTSMATAHVAGLVANIMSNTGNYEPPSIYASTMLYSKFGKLDNIGEGSPNLLASNIDLL